MEKGKMRKKVVFTAVFAVLLIVSFNLSAKYRYRLRYLRREAVPVQFIEPENVAETFNSAFSLQESFVNVARMVKPAVVQVTTEKTVTLRYWDPFGNLGDVFRNPFEDFFQPREPKRKEYQQKQKSLGSGFIVDSSGYILTNNHVVKDMDKIMVKLMDEKKELKATVIGTDSKTDLAILKIKGFGKFPTVKLGDSEAIRVGEWAIAIGNPFGLDETVTVGVISAKGRKGFGISQYEDFIQTDASINPGNSGGPLVNLKGEVIGINTFIVAPSISSGIGFAIPINMAKDVFSQLKEKGRVVRGWLGIIIQPLTEELRNSFGLGETEGVLIGDVMKNSPAEKGGLKRGDVIIQFDQRVIKEPDELSRIAANTAPGKTIPVKIIRERKEKTLEIKIEEMPAEESLIAEKEGEEYWRGLNVEAITEDLMKRFNLDTNEGVMVNEVESGSSADEAGIRKGTIIKQINQKRINNLSDYTEAIGGIKKNKDAILLIQEGKYTRFVILKGEEK